jgi:hypothetical protein
MAMSKDWAKSSLSNGNGGNNCLEGRLIAATDNGSTVEIRDTKDPSGPTLKFTKAEWEAFIGGVKQGEFDLSA